MSHILELLGRGLQSDIGDMLDRFFWSPQTAGIDTLHQRCQENPDWPDLQFQLGVAYLRAVQLDEAIDHLRQACHRKPDYLAARLALASAYVDKAMMPDALEQLELANQNQPGELPILFAMGFCYEKLGDHHKAQEYYTDVITSDGGFLPARERLAAIAVATEDVENAIVQYEQLREMEPQKLWVRTALGHLYYRAGRYADAVEEYECAIAMEPENWALVDDEVEALVADGRVREAIERLHGLLEDQGEFPDMHVRLGDLYSQVGDDQAAMEHYHSALEIQPAYLEATVKLGTHHLISGRWDQAAEAFHQATELNDKAMLSYVGLGVSQMASGKRAEALSSFDLAASIEPNSTLLMSEMARLQLKAAVADEFLKSFEIHPDEPVSDISLDNDDLLQRQLDRHAAQIEKCPEHADLRYRYGVLLRAEDRAGEAMEQFAKAVEINPAYVQALIKLGITQQELGLEDEAIATFKRVLEIEPEYVDMHYRLGILYTDRNQFNKAIVHMEQAAEGASDNEQIRAGLALCLQNMGLMDRAAATWRSLWKIHQGASA